MTKYLMNYLCDPYDYSNLELLNPEYDSDGQITSGFLQGLSGKKYPIINGIPRFVDNYKSESVESFGDQWNFFNFDLFKQNWIQHTIENTFQSLDYFKDKVVVDAGAGSGMQTEWIAEAGARHVIALELSHAVDQIIKKNLSHRKNVDIVQCSIDRPPLKLNSIEGLVICHNVIQHTESVEKTAESLWNVVKSGGEFAFNCYPKNDKGLLRKLRLCNYYFLRAILSRCPFIIIKAYANFMALMRFVPIVGFCLEKLYFMVRGDVVKGDRWFYRAYKAGFLNTFDCYGSHSYQHLKSDEEIKNLVNRLQPNLNKVLNYAKYFSRPQPIGIALRLIK